MADKKKRNSNTLDKKVEIITLLESGKQQEEVAALTNVSRGNSQFLVCAGIRV